MAEKVVAHFTARVRSRPCLKLPFEIVKKHLHGGPLLIQGPNGADYHVEVVKEDNKIYLGDGWIKFEQEHGLERGDILLCLLYKCSVLWIEVIEKNGTQHMGSAPNLNANFQKKTNKRKPMEYPDTNSSGKMAANLKQEKMFEEAENVEEVEKPTSDPESSIDKKLKEIIEAARKRLNDRYHILEFTSSKLVTARCTLSERFAANISVEKGGTVNLVVLPGSEKKQIRWYSYPKFKSFGAGWSEFCLSHKIEEGDLALLEVANQNTIYIRIYHCNNPYSLADFCKQLGKCYSGILKTPHESFDVGQKEENKDPFPTDDELRAELSELLDNVVDLSTLTFLDVLKQLRETFKIDLTELNMKRHVKKLILEEVRKLSEERG